MSIRKVLKEVNLAQRGINSDTFTCAYCKGNVDKLLNSNEEGYLDYFCKRCGRYVHWNKEKMEWEVKPTTGYLK